MKTVNLSKIIQLVNSGNYSKAEFELKNLIKSQPKNFILNKIYGVSLMAQQKYLLAIRAFEICQNLNGDDYDVNVNLSYLFSKTQDYKMSLLYSKNSINIDANRPEAYQNMAECYLNLKRFDEAEKYILSAINKRGGLESKEIVKFQDTLNLYGDILLAKKEKKRFCDYVFEILDRGNHLDQLLISLIRINKHNMKKIYLDKMDYILKNINSIKSLKSRSLTESNIYFILAEYFQKVDNHKSEKYYLKANGIIASLQRGSLYNRQKRISNIINSLKNYKIQDTDFEKLSKKGDGLIFVIGMPRSGTTLLESIISTADDCVAGGEKLFFSLEIDQQLREEKKLNLDNVFLSSLGDRYLETIAIQRNGKKFFIDKLPENFMYVGYIKKIFPKAKFIHIYRDPWDNAISLFKQNYAFNLSYSSSFFGIALEYANYEYIMSYWRKSSEQVSFVDVDYKELVSKTKLITKKIWDYCGLDGEYNEERRLDFFSPTASKQQVTKDIFQTSLEKGDFSEFKSQFLEDLNQQRKYWEDNADY